MVHIPKPKRPLKNSTVERYNRVLKFIQDSRTFRGQGPTLQDLADFLKVKSIGTASFHLKRMEDLGLLERSGSTGGEITLPQYQLTKADKDSLRDLKRRDISLAEIIRVWREL